MIGVQVDLLGRTFGRLRVTKFIGMTLTRGGRPRGLTWQCECLCGKIVLANSNDLTKKNRQSCGCLRDEKVIQVNTKHGEASQGKPTREYLAWIAMRSRCSSKNSDYFKRGIKVCKRWQNSFQKFLADMGRSPGRGYSIDRKDTYGNYEPGNCRWATQSQQNSNRRKYTQKRRRCLPSQKESVTCDVCGKICAGRIPDGGDGSALIPFWHKINGEICIGSKMLALEFK